MKKFVAIIFLILLPLLPSIAASLSEAEELYRAGDMENALIRANAVELEAECKADTTSLLKCWSILGMCYAERGDVLQVAKYTKLILNTMGSAGEDVHFVTSSLYNVARVYRRCNQPEEALKYLEMCMAYETQLNRPSVLAQRYHELAEVYCDMKDWDKALSVVESAIDFYAVDRNNYILGSLYYIKGICEQNLGNDEAALNSIRRCRTLCMSHMKTPDRVPASCYIKLAEYACKESKPDSAYIFYKNAVKSSRIVEDAETERTAFLGLAELEKDQKTREGFLKRADSLSFAMYVSEFTAKTAYVLLDFPRKQHEQKIKMQTTLVIIMAVLFVLVLLLAASLTYNVRYFRGKARAEAEKNAALSESNRQKDKLLALASAAVEEKERTEISKLAKVLGNPSEIKLTKREREVAKYASEGLQNKEIAEKRGINTRTVEAHRNSLYHKLGINNAIELSNYMNRIKYLSDNDS